MKRKPKPAQKHHFVPAGYLGRFATPRGRKGELFVFDVTKRRDWRGTPETQARVLDLYTVEGDEPDKVEKLLAQTESSLLLALQRIERGERSLPDVAKAVCFVALQAIRGPERIDATRDFMAEVADMILRLSVNSEAIFDASIRAVAERDPAFDADRIPQFEEMRELIESGTLRMQPQPGAVVGLTLSVLDTAFRALMTRRNVIVTSVDQELITGSRPVTLMGPGVLGLATAQVIMMPLSPRVLLLSLRDDPDVGWLEAPPGFFASVNAVLVSQSPMLFGSELAVRAAVQPFLAAEARDAAATQSPPAPIADAAARTPGT